MGSSRPFLPLRGCLRRLLKHTVKLSSKRIAIARNAPRNATGKFLRRAIRSEKLTSGDVLELTQRKSTQIRMQTSLGSEHIESQSLTERNEPTKWYRTYMFGSKVRI